MSPVSAALAAWTLILSLAVTAAADPAEPSTGLSSTQNQQDDTEVAALVNARSLAAPTNTPGPAPADISTVPSPARDQRGDSAPATTITVKRFAPSLGAAGPGPTRQNGKRILQASAVGLVSGISSSPLSLYLMCSCVVLLVGIAYMVRQLHNANIQLGRRTQDLSRSNDQLKREVAERQKEVAERRMTESALRASENFYYSLVETVPQNIFRKDLAGKYTFANRAFCATLGMPVSEIVGKTDQDLFPAELAVRFRREDEQVLASAKQIEREQNYPTLSGAKISVLMIRTPLFDTEGRPIGIQGIFWDISERKRSEKELVAVHRQLVEASRRVGMAEVATGVLHNVGNVLNSVNVSATLVAERIKKSRVLNVGKVAALLCEHADEAHFWMADERGKQLPGYVKDLAEHLRKEQTTILGELHSLLNNIEHIKEIVVMQQANAKLSGLCVAVKASGIVEDALRMNSSGLTRHEVQVVREFEDDLSLIVDKHAALQILVNLIRNAKHACDESGRPDKQIRLRICKNGKDRITIQVVDNGVGIPAENLSRLFARGFTTRVDGHGFGLHSCLLAAQEMGGTLKAHSDGPGQGAVFTLELPCQPQGGAP